MDIADYKKYALPKIEVGKMVAAVRQTLKEVAHSEQDVYEKQKEIYKPIIEKLEEEAEEISALKEKLTPGVPALPAPPPLLPLPAPELMTEADTYLNPDERAARRKTTADPDNAYNDDELEILGNLGLSKPSEVFDEGLESDNYERVYDKHIEKSKDKIKEIGIEKRKLTMKNKKSADPVAAKANDEKYAKLTKLSNTTKDYQKQLEAMKTNMKMVLKKKGSGWATKKRSKIGSGVIYYNNPRDLLDRLQLLGGTIAAGNNSSKVKNEYSEIAHALHNLNQITNKDLNNLLKVVI